MAEEFDIRTGSNIWSAKLTSKMEKPIIVAIDMDGLLTALPDSGAWEKDEKTGLAPWEQIGNTMFMDAVPQEKGVLLAQALERKTEAAKGPGWIVTIVTKMHNDAAIAVHHTYQKIQWLNKHLPGANIAFCPVSMTKAERIAELLGRPLDKNCILIDDYPQNIVEWENAGGLGFIWNPSEKTKNKYPNRNYVGEGCKPEELVSMIEFYTQVYRT